MARRTAVLRRYGDQDIAAVRRLPEDPFFVRLLVVHPTDGLHVLMLDGSPLATWHWADVHVAEVKMPAWGRRPWPSPRPR